MNKLETKIKNVFHKNNRADWELVKFGSVANEIKESVSNPAANGIDKIVGLEHLAPMDLHVRSWGDIEDGTTFTRKFRKGQILFGRRRAYQRKAAMAEFDGVCSGDIIVMEANEDKIEPSLLLFIVQSDGFYNWAVSTSAGSLSPRTKFKDLAKFEFRLPPRPLQKKMAELLWSADELREKHYDLLRSQELLFSSWFSDRLSNISQNKKQTLGSLLIEKPKYGASLSAVPYKEGMPRYVRITDVDITGKLKTNDIVTIPTQDYQKYILSDHDILIARTADPGKCFLYEEEYGPCVYAGYLIKFKLDQKKMMSKFFYLYSKSSAYKSFISSTMRTGTVSNINAEEFQSMSVPVIDLEDQKCLIKESLVFEKGLVTQKEAIDSTSSLILGVTNILLI